MNLKKTVEGILVSPESAVYEIVYRYYNAETSLAVPHLTSAGNVPNEYQVYKVLSVCLKECDRLNNRIKEGVFITRKSRMNV